MDGVSKRQEERIKEVWRVSLDSPYDPNKKVAKVSSLHSHLSSADMRGDRSRIAKDEIFDYTNVYGWNLVGKQKGC